jgi:hypothetical protein
MLRAAGVRDGGAPMDLRGLVPWLLALHVLAAIVAIGPNFAFSTIRALGRRRS